MRAMTNAMDTVIGKILDKVDSLDSDTYVIFIGDNGTPMYGGTLGDQIDNMYLNPSNRAKGSAYEGGAHVPMAIRGPGIAAGGQSSEPVHVADLSATILTLAGLTPPTQNYNKAGALVDSDSKSLTPVLFGSTSPLRDPNEGYLLTETNVTQWSTYIVGARNATYKVVCTTASNCTFYNLVSDPLEQSPLSKPGSCSDFRTWPTSNPDWHYCRLMEVLTNYSIF
jgi:arylsulfatase A-like enzyme